MISRAVLVLALVLGAPTLWSQGFPSDTIQDFRGRQGLTNPAWDPGLAQACASRAEALAAAGVLSHEDDFARGPGVQMLTQGFPPGEYGEILGAGADEEAIWAAWLASDSHREVLLTPGWTRWASAGVRAGKTTVWVVRFWRP